MATEYGKRLKAARHHAGLTQDDLAERTGLPQSTISTAEREGHGSASTPIYAKACGVDALWLATGEGSMDHRYQQQLLRLVCPKHGEVQDAYIQITDGVALEGKWCLACYMEKLDELGVHRVQAVFTGKSLHQKP